MDEKPRVLRSKKDGFIYWWTPELAKREDMEEIPYEEAFPERKVEVNSDTIIPPRSKVYTKRSGR